MALLGESVEGIALSGAVYYGRIALNSHRPPAAGGALNGHAFDGIPPEWWFCLLDDVVDQASIAEE